MAIGLVVACSAASAMPPPDDSSFTPSSRGYTGPTTIQFSAFCFTLKAGETAEKSQYVMWANHTVVKLADGTVEIEENGSGGYAPDPGERIRRFKSGWLVRNREDGQMVYYFDNGMPGSTSIRYHAKTGSQRLEPLLNRFVFSSSCAI